MVSGSLSHAVTATRKLLNIHLKYLDIFPIQKLEDINNMFLYPWTVILQERTILIVGCSDRTLQSSTPHLCFQMY